MSLDGIQARAQGASQAVVGTAFQGMRRLGDGLSQGASSTSQAFNWGARKVIILCSQTVNGIKYLGNQVLAGLSLVASKIADLGQVALSALRQGVYSTAQFINNLPRDFKVGCVCATVGAVVVLGMQYLNQPEQVYVAPAEQVYAASVKV